MHHHRYTKYVTRNPICANCGSTAVVPSSAQLNDFPSQHLPVQCGNCGELKGIIGVNSLRDLLRSRDEETKKFAKALMEI